MASQGFVVGGRYRLDSVLGSGGMGVVWRAFDERLARWVAVKEIRFTQPMTPEEREDLKRRAMGEALSAGRLIHPNVVAIYDAVDDADQPWIVMRLVDGRPLREVVSEDGPLDPVAAARLGLGLLDALDAAHAAGVVHRDVKPSNVLLSGGRPLLTDFSIATVVGAQVPIRGGAIMGSPGYVAPERLHGEEGTAAADLFGLGATLFYAVEGVGPFARGDALACLIATVCEPHPRPRLAGPLTGVIDGLLAKDEADRIDSAGARAGLVAAATPRHRGVYRVPLTSRRTYTPYRGVAVVPPAPAPAGPPPPPDPRRSRPARRRVTLLTASAALLVPVAATIASAAGGSGNGVGRADAAVRQPAPPGMGTSTEPPDGRLALGMPDVASPTASTSTSPDQIVLPVGHMPIAPVKDTTGGVSTTEPNGGGGGQPGTTAPPPAPAEVTGLSVAVAVDPTACTYSASASVTVSGATAVTYRVSWTDGADGTASTEFTSAGSGTLSVPSNVAHGAGPVWVQVEVMAPTAVTQRGNAELPASCSPAPPPPPPPSPVDAPVDTPVNTPADAPADETLGDTQSPAPAPATAATLAAGE